MNTTAWAALFLPLFMFVLAFFVLNPAKRLVMRYLPEGKLKRLLLYRVN